MTHTPRQHAPAFAPSTTNAENMARSTAQLTTAPQAPLGAMIRTARIARRMSQHDLALALDCDKSWISRIEGGTRTLDPDMIPAFAAALGLDPHDLALAIAGLDPISFRRSLVDPLVPLVPDSTAARTHLWATCDRDWWQRDDDELEDRAA